MLSLLVWDFYHLYRLRAIYIESVSITELMKSIKEKYNTDKFDINMRDLYHKLYARF